jgi:hypothetical protein
MLIIDVPRSCFIITPNRDFLRISSKNDIMKDESTISPELKKFMNYHKIANVADLLSIDNYTLLDMDGFGWRMMKEVLDLREVE